MKLLSTLFGAFLCGVCDVATLHTPSPNPSTIKEGTCSRAKYDCNGWELEGPPEYTGYVDVETGSQEVDEKRDAVGRWARGLGRKSRNRKEGGRFADTLWAGMEP